MIADDTLTGSLAEDRTDTRAVSRRIPGEAGTWIFILGDMTVFALLFGAYIEARSNSPELLNEAQQSLSRTFGTVNTVLLLCSSLLVITAIRAVRTGAQPLARAMVTGAFGLGLGFIVIKYFEWNHHISAHETVGTNEFWLYYYLLTGLHLFHLVIGMGLLVFILSQIGRPSLHLTRRFTFVEGSACYWHMVDLLWVVLFPLFYLVS